MKNLKLFLFLIIATLILYSCNEDTKNKNNTNHITEQNYNPKAKIEISHKDITIGDSIIGSFKVDSTSKTDSVVLFLDSKRILSSKNKQGKFVIQKEIKSVGEKTLELVMYYKDKSTSTKKYIRILSDIEPKLKTYKVVKEYPHDRDAYTQGLVYYNDILYESTGLETKSTLRKTKIETGEVLLSTTLESNYFGEGITIFNNQIIQVTWRNHIGIVYNIDNFQKIMNFSYPTEGWGLATDGKVIYMSDGTNIIYIIDPNTYSTIGEIEVYDNKGPVKLLNELEYINGYIYANVYTMDYITVIDPQTGKVVQNINMTGILSNNLRDENTDVLNGIAYDSKRNRIFVTGKNWPKLFEIKIVDKK